MTALAWLPGIIISAVAASIRTVSGPGWAAIGFAVASGAACILLWRRADRHGAMRPDRSQRLQRRLERRRRCRKPGRSLDGKPLQAWEKDRIDEIEARYGQTAPEPACGQVPGADGSDR